MSSELSITRGYSKFWEELLIINSRVFINDLNKNMVSKDGVFDSLEIKDARQRHGLINETAFSIFSKYCSGETALVTVQKMDLNDPVLKETFREQLKKWRSYLPGREFMYEITENELMVIKALIRRLIHSFSNKKNLIVSPEFDGCGIVDRAKGDIYYKTTLVEVKAGDENFGMRDIRQLLVYGALNFRQAEPLHIEYFQLYNPRRAITWKERVDIVIDYIAGCSSTEFFNQLIDFISCEYRSL